MDDDKREKLREYLRNNRSKNRVNLGNNSDNKENSNKNLEDDLNLDNSQISHNKTNSHKRDYDKKPIIIKDYGNFYQLFIYLSFWFIVVIICGKDAWNRDGIYQGKAQVIIGVVAISISAYLLIRNTFKYFKDNKQKFIFTKDTLSYIAYEQNTTQNINNINSVCRLFIGGNHTYGKNAYQNKTLFQLFFKTDILELFYYLFIVIYTTILYLIFILPYRIIFQKAFFILNKNFLILFNDGSFMNITINSKNEYDEIIKYFKFQNIEVKKKVKFIQISYKEF
ncbi:hypothetical protein [uncultured Campylobacter sp.]|uniref:hypothetical protein n=1 Tax=uncultured Campylobacter sp. TaxID=218934 RepID=UPI00262C422E|nr:hypothetical protein [uncultured Campylobacter sp.]